MMLLSMALTFLALFLVGRWMVRHLGWPTSRDAVVRWMVSLLVLAVIASSLPAALDTFLAGLPPLPKPSAAEVLVGLFLLGLAAVGYLAVQKGAEDADREAERDERARSLPRLRAVPPPPPPPTLGPSTARTPQARLNAGGEAGSSEVRVEGGRVVLGRQR